MREIISKMSYRRNLKKTSRQCNNTIPHTQKNDIGHRTLKYLLLLFDVILFPCIRRIDFEVSYIMDYINFLGGNY